MYMNLIEDDYDIEFHEILCLWELIQCFLNQED